MAAAGTGPARLVRSSVIGAGAFVALVLILRFVDSGGTPGAIVFQGIALGSVTALVAVGIVLIYRTSRVINFAQAAIGGVGGAFAYGLMTADNIELPFVPAFILGVIGAGLTGVAIELAFVRRFFNSPRLVLIVVTVALLPALGFLSGFVSNLPIFGDLEDRDPAEVAGLESPPMPFDDFEFTVGGLPIPFGTEHVFAIGLTLVSLIALGLFLKYTKVGTAVRAMAVNAERAQLLGINVLMLSTLVWGITGLLSGTGVILNGMMSTSFGVLAGGIEGAVSATLIIALAAAVLARMQSITVAALAAVALNVLFGAFQFHYDEGVGLFFVALFAVVLAALLLQRREAIRSEQHEASSWDAVQEFRSTPREMLQVTGVRIWRGVFVVLAVIVAGLYPWFMSTGGTFTGGFLAIAGIAILSLVLLTGWTGQISLGQFSFVAVGALSGGWLVSTAEISFWLALPIGAVITGIFAVIVGLTALRLRGLYLAVATLVFAFAAESILFNEQVFGWLQPGEVARPSLFLVDFDDERSMYYLALAGFLLCVGLLVGLRRSRPGRVLIGARDNEPNLEAFGINPMRIRLAAFAISGALCGFAGVLMAVHQHGVEQNTFLAQQSFNVFIFAVIGGIGSITGGILGTIFFGFQQLFGGNQLLQFLVGPLGALIILYIAPGGLASILYGLRDATYRIIAQRRRMVVPSLFADIDPSDLERQMAPLAESLSNAGLAALPFDQRYRVASDIYTIRGKRKDGPRAPDAGGALGAAAAALEDIGGTPATRAVGAPSETTQETGVPTGEIAPGQETQEGDDE